MPGTHTPAQSITAAVSLGCLGHGEEDLSPGSEATKTPSSEGVGDPLQRPPEGPQPVRPEHRATLEKEKLLAAPHQDLPPPLRPGGGVCPQQ